MIDNFFKNKIWLLLTVVAIICSMSIHYGYIYLNSIDVGDFGRDLYNFYLVSKDHLPYIDFNWIYGPLTPLLYGLNFKIFGVSIISAVTLWYLIFFIICLTLYFTVLSFSNHFTAFLSVIFFIGYHGYKIQTFNHSIGILFILLSIFFLKTYLNTDKVKYLYIIGIMLFLLNLTKLNMGLAISLGTYGTLFILHILNKKGLKHIIISSISSLCLTFAIYYTLLYSASFDQLKKCFPYLSEYHQTAQFSLQTLYFSAESAIISPNVILNSFTRFLYYITTLNIWYFIILILGTLMAIIIYRKNQIDNDFTFVVILVTTALLTTHEFHMAQTAYSLRFWTLPLIIILCLFIASYLYTHLKEKTYFKPVFISLTILFIFIFGFKYYNIISHNKNNAVYYPLERAQINITNYQWLLLASEAINYIEKNTQTGEKILTIPYDSFYNFITKRDQPSRITEFLHLSNITPQDEEKIIADIEKNKVKLIMYSIRSLPGTESVEFGKTHCQKLDEYIKKNYLYTQAYYSKDTQSNKRYINSRLSLLYPITFYKRKTPFINEK